MFKGYPINERGQCAHGERAAYCFRCKISGPTTVEKERYRGLKFTEGPMERLMELEKLAGGTE